MNNFVLPVASAEASVEELGILSEKAVLASKIEFYADKYKIDRETFYKTIDCESNSSTTIQSSAYYKNGKREESWGIAQIHLPAHPKITKDMATDADFALNFMAKEFSLGHQSMWSCYNIYFGEK